ncbi:hypothetical protein KAFR_0E04150 [Kazachstania africana CBS 2517]|uniref:Large ribosomal subunit protein uL29m n=1 Tax=Kazachstania africana (strain ATCC 22294 / BCRC 22015 / CBS 2517 / CECT 1963 / NBRC 1671 / NRRL Y-8276) TaxID=1071382 RepID=H2AW16_KAZAF|nr:hypothetical protein KAFR_0E04150 [Kazachstania africana CBS 2517]CCF58566.1 hypothetical protein KAFR_0E04150 [Kazachstania africana CBS 2517]
MLGRRGFSSYRAAMARTRFTKPKPAPPKRKNVRLPTQMTHHSNNLRITSPIPPATNNLQCPDDHPLWEFFSDRKFIREEAALDSNARSWTVQELRRKSFNDLHSLWYSCLKERNRLAREIHLLRSSLGSNTDVFDSINEKVRTTMWRIRHVLSERDHAFQIANKEFGNETKEFIVEFEKEFLGADKDDTIIWDQLSRFQFAIFGISEIIEDNVVDSKFIQGLKFIASLKLKKFSQSNGEIEEYAKKLGEIREVSEAFVLFTAENDPESMLEACKIVTDLRETGNSVTKNDEIEVVSNYLNELIKSQEEISE